ncbi:LacI family DNA-binding transcriptional regulator [Catenulispora rubra]|uniref:LacI family DNA-binding transcriptional regulator n=1 Tax=Catenulispora rubra TaxID=280293 RepID=UPI00189217A9|nr:LacI family DNA-binding transcriptional regulator [Catenulispora rubra]
MATKLSEVAAFAGVSLATVRRVLNDQPSIAQETRERVLTALDVLGHERPSKLRGHRAGLVGLVVPDLQNPIFPAFVETVSAGLVKQGLMPVLCTRTADGVSEANYIKLLMDHEVAGIVFIGSSYADAGPEHGRTLKERGIPVVLINPADANDGVRRITVDDASAVDQALEHLRALGHTRIGMLLGPGGHIPSARKLGAFVADWERRAAPGSEPGGWRELVAHTGFSMEDGRTATARPLEAGATALICASDALALGAVRAAYRQGMSIPGDLSVVGFDDSPYMIATDPPLTTVRQPVRAMGAAAVDALKAQIGGHAGPPDETLYEPELIVRASTGVVRSR